MIKEAKRAKNFTARENATILKYAVKDFPKMPRTNLAEKILKEVEWLGKLPEVEVIERKISKARAIGLLPLDKPWNISTLLNNEIPPQSLPVVLELFIEHLRKDAVHLTIREAQWIGRLAFVLKDKEMLWQHALECAWSEQVLEATGLEYTEIGADALLYESMKSGTGKGINRIKRPCSRFGRGR